MRHAQARQPNGKAIQLVAIKWQGESFMHDASIPENAERYNITFKSRETLNPVIQPDPRGGFAPLCRALIATP